MTQVSLSTVYTLAFNSEYEFVERVVRAIMPPSYYAHDCASYFLMDSYATVISNFMLSGYIFSYVM